MKTFKRKASGELFQEERVSAPRVANGPHVWVLHVLHVGLQTEWYKRSNVKNDWKLNKRKADKITGFFRAGERESSQQFSRRLLVVLFNEVIPSGF